MRAEAVRQLRYQATHDVLTGLQNRKFDTYFISELREKCEQLSVTVFFMDVNGFKFIIDTLGHALGDEVLIVVVNRLNAGVCTSGVMAR